MMMSSLQLLRSSTSLALLRRTALTSARHSSSAASAKLAPTENNVILCPPNLRIDYRAKSSPFYGLAKLENLDHKKNVNVEDDSEEDSEEDLEELVDQLKDLAIAYDASSGTPAQSSVRHAIPLPDRLTVPIKSFALHDENSVDGEDLTLAEDVFGMHPIRKDLIHRVVVYQRNKKRGVRYPALTKTINTKSGSGKKMRPQKGQGRARAGHKRAAHWRGGAKAHGPKGVAQDYTTKLNKKVRKLGLKHMLSQKLLEGNLILVDNFEVDSYKTKHLASHLIKLGSIGGRYGTTAFMVDADIAIEQDANFRVAQKNIKQVKFVSQLGCNVYDMLKTEKLVLSVDAVNALQNRLS